MLSCNVPYRSDSTYRSCSSGGLSIAAYEATKGRVHLKDKVQTKNSFNCSSDSLEKKRDLKQAQHDARGEARLRHPQPRRSGRCAGAPFEVHTFDQQENEPISFASVWQGEFFRPLPCGLEKETAELTQPAQISWLHAEEDLLVGETALEAWPSCNMFD